MGATRWQVNRELVLLFRLLRLTSRLVDQCLLDQF